MLIVGLTGGSGSGKGYISSLMERIGICIIDTDKVYHDMISTPGKCVNALVSEFGTAIVSETGGINRSELATIVFSDSEKLKKLNEITHAMILDRAREIMNDAENNGCCISVVDAPALFESGFDRECDFIVGVTAPFDLRLLRILSRDNISRDRALSRMANQKDDDYFRAKCDYIIENDGHDIKEDVEKLMSVLMRKYEEKKKKQEKN